MAQDTETFNGELYNLLKVRGYKPVPLNSQNQRVGASQEADVIEFTFNKGEEKFNLLFRYKSVIVIVDISKKLDRLLF